MERCATDCWRPSASTRRSVWIGTLTARTFQSATAPDVALSEQALQDYWLRADLAGWWLRLRPEQANFRRALWFSFDRGEAAEGLRLACGLWVLWGFCGPWTEGRQWISRLLAMPAAADDMAARGLLLDAVELQRHVGGSRGLAMALEHAGLAARARRDFDASRAFHKEALAIVRAAHNEGYAAVSVAALAHAVCLESNYEEARRLATESLAIVTWLQPAQCRLGGEAAAVAWQAGEGLSMDHANLYARAFED